MVALGVVLIALSILYGVVNFVANERLPSLLGENVEIQHVDIQIFGLTANFREPMVKLEGTDNSPDLKILAIAKSISIKGFSVMELLFSKTLGVKQFEINGLKLSINLPDSAVLGSERKDINLFVTDIFTRIKVEQFELKNSELVVSKSEQGARLIDITGFNLEALDITLDTASIEEFFPLRFKESNIAIDSFAVNAGQDYRFYGSNLRIEDGTLSTTQLRLVPNDSWEEFAKNHSYEKAMLDMSVDSLYIGDLMWDKPKKSRFMLHANHADLHGLRILVCKDKRAPQQPIVVKPLLTGLIQALPLSLSIDTVRFVDSYIAYEQLPVLYPRVGKVFFDKLYMTGYNITNDSEVIAENPETRFDIQTLFMGRGNLKVQILLDLKSEHQAFKVNGNLGAMPITYVNQVLAPLAGIKAEGDLQRMVFQFDGDNYDSHGQMNLEYSGLHVIMMGQKKEKSLLKSFFGNLLLSKKNQKSDSNYKEGEIYFIRYQNKDFFNLLWNSVRVGLMDIVIPFYKNEDKNRSPEEGVKYKIEKE